MKMPSAPKGNPFAGVRQNRLLPVIILLVVAIAAVPLLLKSEPAPAPAPVDPSLGAAEGSSEAVPAVFVDSEGVRDYRKRLNLLQEKNPFADHFRVPDAVVAETGAVTETPESQVPDIGEPVPTPATSDFPIADAPAVVPDVVVEETDTGGTETTTEVVVEETEVRLSYHVDLEIGLAGQAQKREDVESLTVLPSKSRPVVIFNGVTEDGEEAVFSLSSDVTGSSGEGSCVPSAVDCQFLNLKPGERRELTYAPEGATPSTYVLRLTEIKSVVVETTG